MVKHSRCYKQSPNQPSDWYSNYYQELHVYIISPATVDHCQEWKVVLYWLQLVVTLEPTVSGCNRARGGCFKKRCVIDLAA